MVKNPSSNVGDAGSIPGLGTKIPCVARPKKQKQNKKTVMDYSPSNKIHIPESTLIMNIQIDEQRSSS